MKHPEQSWAGHNKANAVPNGYHELPVRLLEETEVIAKELQKKMGESLLVAEGCLYWPMVAISEPYPKNGAAEVRQVVRRINESVSYGSAYGISFDAPELPNIKPGELAPITLRIRSTATAELLLESGLIQYWLGEKDISSRPTTSLDINLTDEPVPYGLFLNAYRILQPYAHKTMTLGPPTVAQIENK